jgi:hypothetical protein
MDREQEFAMVGGQCVDSISDEMRHSFWRAFGHTPDAQIALEKLFEGIKFSDTLGNVGAVPYVNLLQGIRLFEQLKP